MKRLIAAAALGTLLAGCNFSIGNVGNETDNDSAAANKQQAREQAPSMARFVNSRANATSEALQRHYTDFSFEYPRNWVREPQPTNGTASNYVGYVAPDINGLSPYAVHVGYAFGSGNAEQDRAGMQQALPGIARDFGRGFNNYQITSVGMDRVGNYDSFNWRFSATASALNGGPPGTVYGRGDIVLPPGSTAGVLIATLTTDRAHDAESPSEVGESGVLKDVLDSFEVGGAAPAK